MGLWTMPIPAVLRPLVARIGLGCRRHQQWRGGVCGVVPGALRQHARGAATDITKEDVVDDNEQAHAGIARQTTPPLGAGEVLMVGMAGASASGKSSVTRI